MPTNNTSAMANEGGDLNWLREMSNLHGWEVVGRAVARIEAQEAAIAALQQQNESLAARLQAAEARCAELEEIQRLQFAACVAAESDLIKAERERDANRRDAERWVFVRDNWHNLCTATGCNEVGDYIVTEIFVGVGEHIPFKDGSVQAAIDAALHGQKDGRDG